MNKHDRGLALISLASVGYDDSRAAHFCCTWSSNQAGGGVILAFSSFFTQISRQKESEISVGILSPT
jgi:hypothetical protein